MQIYDDEGNRIGTIKAYKNRSITSTLSSGDKELSFEYPVKGKLAKVLREECYIRTKEDEFVIKSVESGETYNKYIAALNVEDLEGKVFRDGFESETQTVRACLENAFAGTGWTIGTCSITKKRTIRIQEETNAWGVLQSCLSTYRCECNINSRRKTIDIYEQIGVDRGCYFIDGLNLRKLTVKSDTYSFYTRIIPIGRDGLTIESLVGQDYIENHQYSDKIKTYVWRDERYTNAESLLEDAEAKLEEMSRPYKAFTADVIDLARANEEYEEILDYRIGDTVYMLSKRAGVKEKQRIVKIVEYPEDPKRNTVELSNSTKSFAEIQQEEVETAKETAVAIANAETDEKLEEYSTSEEVEKQITIAEDTLNERIDETDENLADEVNRATSAEGVLNTRIEQTDGNITLEVTRAISAEESLSSRINMTDANISLEVTRAISAEESLSSRINMTDANISLEVTRAISAEESLSSRITMTDSSIEQKVTKGQSYNGMTISDTGLDISGTGAMKVNMSNFKLDAVGKAEFCGKIIAETGGKIGEFDITDDGLECGANGTKIWANTIKTDLVEPTKGSSDLSIGKSGSSLNLWANPTFNEIGSSGSEANVCIGSAGRLNKITASARRHKNSIMPVLNPELDPHRILNIPIVQFRFNTDYLCDQKDKRYNRDVVGMIADDVAKHYPIAADYEGEVVENWNSRYLIPPMIYLIQEQSKKMDKMEFEIISIKESVQHYKMMEVI